MRTLRIALVLVAAVPAAADTLSDLPDPSYSELPATALSGAIAGRIDRIVYPTIGFPSIVAHGDTLTVLFRSAVVASPDFEVRLRRTRGPVRNEERLVVARVDRVAGWDGYQIVATVGPTVGPDMYDLLVVERSQGLGDGQPNAVRVLERMPDRFRFVHLADSQHNDPRGLMDPGNLNAAGFDSIAIVEQALAEVRYLDPLFTVLSGDLLFGIEYESEYDGAYELWKDAGVPVFMVPGNHDGYTTTRPYGIAGYDVDPRDGLEYWRRYMGPLYYSFDVGAYHFVAVNSYDASVDKREGILHVAPNSGGMIDAAQMAWLRRDLAAADAAGKQTILFMHHNPRGDRERAAGPYVDPIAFQPEMFLTAHARYFTSGSLFEEDPVWNDENSGKALVDLIQGTPSVSHVLIGHVHHDRVERHGKVTWVETTTMASGPHTKADYWGYRLMEFDRGTIRLVDYEPGTRQSIPSGNLILDETDNDGAAAKATIRVDNGLSRSMSGRLTFHLAASPQGYRATGGTIVEIRPVAHQAIVVVETDAPAGAAMNSPTSHVVVVEAIGPTVPAPAPGCQALPPGAAGDGWAAAEFLFWLLVAPVAAWGLGRRRRAAAA